MTSYSWNITDPALVKKIKNASNKESWDSPTFSLHGFRWHLQIWPNGPGKEGITNSFLCLASLPPKVQQVQVNYEVRIKEMDFVFGHTYIFSKDTKAAPCLPNEKTTFEQLQKHDHLTMTASIDLVAVYDKEDNDITAKYLQHDEQKMDVEVMSAIHCPFVFCTKKTL